MFELITSYFTYPDGRGFKIVQFETQDIKSLDELMQYIKEQGLCFTHHHDETGVEDSKDDYFTIQTDLQQGEIEVLGQVMSLLERKIKGNLHPKDETES